jgi:hypothetical protein
MYTAMYRYGRRNTRLGYGLRFGVEINEPCFAPTVEIEQEEKTRRGEARPEWIVHVRG